jgi:SAM-dependent methyltransferase
MYAAARQLHPEIPIDRFPSALAVREVKKLRSLVHRRKPSFLDYGSGYGRWARAAVNEGFEVYAFEPSQHRGAEDDAPFVLIHNVNELNGKTFDVVNLEQVLEHVLDPHALLIEIKNVCHAESIIRVSVPNILRCDEGKEIWRDWPFDGHRSHIMAPFEHLHGFTPLSLTKLVARSRYKSIPFTDLLRYYPTSVPRRAIGRFFEQVGQTKLILHQDGV